MWRIVLICVGLVGILSVIEIVVLAGSRRAYDDPFAPYAAIMPGQPSAALEQYPCNIYIDDASTAHCTFALTDGPFDSVHVVYDEVIKWIDFTIHPGSLHLGDLIQCWGKLNSVMPNTAQFRRGFVDVNWDQQRYAAVVAGRYDTRPNFLLAIRDVSIAGQWQPCRSSQ
ncbi:MAG: hypothetical protein ACYDBJ_01555 [Aggregatilineales bacterium]